TGSNRTRNDLVIGGGEQLQPMLYALAVERMLSNTVSISRLFFSTSRGGFAKNDVDITERTKAKAFEVLERVEEAVKTGFLPPVPREKNRWVACDYCDFLSVCGPYE